MPYTIDQLIDLTKNSDVLRDELYSGYNDLEIQDFTKQFSFKFPPIYIEYLSKLGKRNPGLSEPRSTSFEALKNINEYLEWHRLAGIDILATTRRTPYFFQIQDGLEVYSFFEGEDDPIVFQFLEFGWESLEITFTEHIHGTMLHIIELTKRLAWYKEHYPHTNQCSIPQSPEH